MYVLNDFLRVEVRGTSTWMCMGGYKGLVLGQAGWQNRLSEWEGTDSVAFWYGLRPYAEQKKAQLNPPMARRIGGIRCTVCLCKECTGMWCDKHAEPRSEFGGWIGSRGLDGVTVVKLTLRVHPGL